MGSEPARRRGGGGGSGIPAGLRQAQTGGGDGEREGEEARVVDCPSPLAPPPFI